MKQFSFFVIATLLILSSATAQTRSRNVPSITQGYTQEFAGINGTPVDSLQVTDSLGYYIPISHLNTIDNFLFFTWTKIGAGTATLGINFYQSIDGINYTPVLQKQAQTAYTKSYSLSATTPEYISFRSDSATFEGRYLKVLFFTSATASVKGKLDCLLKTAIK